MYSTEVLASETTSETTFYKFGQKIIFGHAPNLNSFISLSEIGILSFVISMIRISLLGFILQGHFPQ